MLRVDNRAGSADLYEALKAAGAEAVLTRLSAGDVEMVGHGPAGPEMFGIEYKTVHDMLQCMADRRFVDVQLPAMRQQFTVSWLLIEGMIKHGPAGEFMVYRAGQWVIPGVCRTYEAWIKWLLGLSMRGRVVVAQTSRRAESVAWVRAWHENLLAPWDSHTSHTGIADPMQNLPMFQLEPITYVQRFAAILPGIGAKKSMEVARKFQTIEQVAYATAEEWTTIDGIGPIIAEKVIRAIRENK